MVTCFKPEGTNLPGQGVSSPRLQLHGGWSCEHGQLGAAAFQDSGGGREIRPFLKMMQLRAKVGINMIYEAV